MQDKTVNRRDPRQKRNGRDIPIDALHKTFSEFRGPVCVERSFA